MSPDRSPWPAHAAEVLCVGTELLVGSILNGNARWLAERLSALALPHYRQGVVGDNPERLAAMVREAAGRCRFLITTGGLGPTPDDLTAATLADTFGEPLEERPALWQELQDRALQLGRRPDPALRRQALLPPSATLLPNPVGSAPGMIWTPDPRRVDFPVVDGFTVLTFPGVPAEMRAMWEATAAGWLASRAGVDGVIRHRTLRFSGLSESALTDRVRDLMALENPTVAPYAGLGEVVLRLSARAPGSAEAAAALEPLEMEIRKRTGSCCYGVDGDSLASVVLELLRRRRQTLAVAESCSGGGLGVALTAVPGASDVFLGGVIAYANPIKQQLLDVDPALLERHGAVSDPVAAAMAEGVRRRFRSDWALALSGVAGPGGGTLDKPVGLVHLALAGPGGTHAQELRFSARRGRQGIQQLSVAAALDRLRLALLEPGDPPPPGS
ncbi:competence/damage-inducible protein A [Synechococcus sp. RSCCF101]|uniref:competence/damage-inducible protein A n=1 Tax=Synechococcus sp. RSCCF101 TaxID=2511069 RepID=UPI001247BBA8|nr:competence/damage-inducible protein A [Synechococcus sp. RSCCF101]QEY32274.1 competence/damage-inducible protein A [Synechococcus sp. RSCCF101]